MAGEIVPFGKYKGKPIEAMVQDRQYVDWLLTQPWFRERHANFYTLIVNNFQEPSDTPEHNALQAKFLDPYFRLAFVHFLQNYPGDAKSLHVEFEHYGFDVRITGSWDTGEVRKWSYAGVSQQESIYVYADYSVEIKPVVADDYPAILRQIKSALAQRADKYRHVPEGAFGDPVLFLQDYTGVGATCEEFIAIFKASGIGVVFLDEVEALITKT